MSATFFDAHFDPDGYEPGWKHQSLTVLPPQGFDSWPYPQQAEWLWRVLDVLTEAAEIESGADRFATPMELVAAPTELFASPLGVTVRVWWNEADEVPVDPEPEPEPDGFPEGDDPGAQFVQHAGMPKVRDRRFR